MDAAEHAAKRAEITAQLKAETGIDNAMIEKLVRTFYDRIAEDEVLGPIFAAKISDWEPHLQKMFAFWSSVTLQTGVYHGRPMPAHVNLPVDARHFDRWLALFIKTAQDTCPPAAAERFIERAGVIASSLEMGVATVAGARVPPGARYRNPELG
jgi:hemoglobin